MKRIILAAAVAVATAGLAGCVAVPAYDTGPAYYGYGSPGYYYAPPAPAVSFYYSNRPYYRHWHRW